MLKLEQLFLLYIFLTYLSQECCCCCNVYRYLLNCYSFHYLISIVIDHQSNNSQSLFHFIICQLKWHNNSTIFDLNAILTYLEGEGCLHGRHTAVPKPRWVNKKEDQLSLPLIGKDQWLLEKIRKALPKCQPNKTLYKMKSFTASPSPWCLVVVVRPNPALRCRWPGNLKVKIQ